LRENYDIYPIGLRAPLPVVGIPLADGVDDARLNLQAVLEKTLEAGAYDAFVRYDLPCRPPLDPEDQAWADGLIRAAGVVQNNPQASS
jgi:hypothetical protein